jgi:hypothetical protein
MAKPHNRYSKKFFQAHRPKPHNRYSKKLSILCNHYSAHKRGTSPYGTVSKRILPRSNSACNIANRSPQVLPSLYTCLNINSHDFQLDCLILQKTESWVHLFERSKKKATILYRKNKKPNQTKLVQSTLYIELS